MKTDKYNATGTFVDGQFKTFDELDAENRKKANKPKPTSKGKTNDKESAKDNEGED